MDDAALAELLDTLGLAMDIDDLKFLQNYFAGEEKRRPNRPLPPVCAPASTQVP